MLSLIQVQLQKKIVLLKRWNKDQKFIESIKLTDQLDAA